MDSIEKWLSTIGAIASIGSALWAFFEARKASKSALSAKLFRDEIVERRKMLEVSQVYSETSRILKTVSTVGPSCNQPQLRGVNCGNIARDVEEYSRFINEQIFNFTDPFGNRAKVLCDDLKEDIEALSEAKTFEDKKAAGKSIYYKISNFMPIVKALSDEKKEREVKR